jgi:hypothetical protein
VDFFSRVALSMAAAHEAARYIRLVRAPKPFQLRRRELITLLSEALQKLGWTEGRRGDEHSAALARSGQAE